MATGNTLQTEYFDDVYDKNDDPWNFQTSNYEKEKYQATINALTRTTYASAFEIGCSIGILTEQLAARCLELFAVDTSDKALASARLRLKDYPNVRLGKMFVPNEFPTGQFDFIIMSEVGYYFSMPDLEQLQRLILQHLVAGGQLLMVHWTPFVHDYPLTGDQVHESFLKISGEGKALKVLLSKREEKYRMNLFEKI